MNFYLIFLLVLGILQVRGSEFVLVCRRNCDNSSLLDPNSDVEVSLDCVKGCKEGLKCVWKLECLTCKQKIDDNYNFTGQFTPAVKLDKIVLYPRETYNLSVTVNKGIGPFSLELSMGKCSRKYPCDDEQFVYDVDYFGTGFVASPNETNVTVLRHMITDQLKHLYNMNNETKAIRQKQLEILNLIDLAIGDNATEFKAAQDEIHKVARITTFHLQVAKRVMEVGIKLVRPYLKINENNKTKLEEATEAMSNWLISIQKDYYKIQLHQLINHQAPKANYPVQNMNGEEDFSEYNDYVDFDVVFRDRKEIIETTKLLHLEMYKLFAFSINQRHKGTTNSDCTVLRFNHDDNVSHKKMFINYCHAVGTPPDIIKGSNYEDFFFLKS